MHPLIRRLLALLLGVGLIAGLAACQKTTGNATTGAATPVVATKIDTKIAETSKQLAQYCTIASLALTTAEAFSSNPSVGQAIGYGKIAVHDFCAAPPANTADAIKSLAAVALDVANAVAQAKAEKAGGTNAPS